MGNTPTENEKEFRDWLRKQVHEDGMRIYSDNEISAYCYALRKSCSNIPYMPISNLFFICDYANFEEKTDMIKKYPEFEELNQEGHGTISAAFELYQFYLEYGSHSIAPDVHAQFYLSRTAETKVEKKQEPMEGFHYQEIPMRPVQKVFYGAPGTGKSHRVNQMLAKEYPEDEKLRTHIKRVIFHPAYTYGEFVGCIKPLISPDRPLEYAFVAGPFTELLKAAFLNPAERYFLVIEEINRGDAPSIFGDIFQLLDRGPLGKSSYTIVNRDIGAYFSRDPWMKNIFFDGRIWIPANFNIVATMNTADDNIFVMDSAFKRRFELEYVQIDYNILPESMVKERSLFYGRRPLREVFGDMNSINGPYAAMLDQKGLLRRNWPTFATLVNHAIDAENLEAKRMGANRDRLIAENKKLGPYFIREGELEDRLTFMNKVIFYLKQDVFCDSFRYFTDSFEDIFEKYSQPESDLFELIADSSNMRWGADMSRQQFPGQQFAGQASHGTGIQLRQSQPQQGNGLGQGLSNGMQQDRQREQLQQIQQMEKQKQLYAGAQGQSSMSQAFRNAAAPSSGIQSGASQYYQ